jgi:predicted transcriptional regulator YdeE
MSLETTVFGPYRAIGVRYAGKNQNQEITELWGRFLPTRNAIAMPENAGAFGVCRCLPGVKDGSFEYLAAFAAVPEATVPGGMVEVDIPRGEYFVHRCESIQDSQQAWQEAAKTLAASPEWVGFCNGPDDCQCATHPCFEYYPPEFSGTGPFYLYLPVHPK